MKQNKETYVLLELTDFKEIAKTTSYSTSHVRQILRGYVDTKDRHKTIIEEADKINAQKNPTLQA